MSKELFFSAKLDEPASGPFLGIFSTWEELFRNFSCSIGSRSAGLLSQLAFFFILFPEGNANFLHKNQVQLSRKSGVAYIQRHVDYQQFLSSDEAGRLALLARALLEGVLELPKARGLKRFDARGLHEALRSFFVSKGVMELEENL